MCTNMNYGEVIVIELNAGVSGEMYPEMESPESFELVPIPAERAGWQEDRYEPEAWKATVGRLGVGTGRKEKFDVRKFLRNLASL